MFVVDVVDDVFTVVVVDVAVVVVVVDDFVVVVVVVACHFPPLFRIFTKDDQIVQPVMTSKTSEIESRA